MVMLRPITKANREEVEALRVGPGQDRFVSSVTESLLEASEEPDGRALFWGCTTARRRSEMWTSAAQGDGSPVTFYEKYGFERTGEIVFDNEVLLRLTFRPST